MRSESINPLREVIHEQRCDRPDSIHRRTDKNRGGPGKYATFKRDWHPISAAVAMLGSLLCQKGHSWNKGQKLMYRKAINASIYPCCPTCGKPMNENIVTTLDGVTRKSWFCAVDPNL